MTKLRIGTGGHGLHVHPNVSFWRQAGKLVPQTLPWPPLFSEHGLEQQHWRHEAVTLKSPSLPRSLPKHSPYLPSTNHLSSLTSILYGTSSELNWIHNPYASQKSQSEWQPTMPPTKMESILFSQKQLQTWRKIILAGLWLSFYSREMKSKRNTEAKGEIQILAYNKSI